MKKLFEDSFDESSTCPMERARMIDIRVLPTFIEFGNFGNFRNIGCRYILYRSFEKRAGDVRI